MNKDILNLQDSINYNDEFQSLRSNSKKVSKFYTEITAYNELGEQVWKPKHNELIIPGGLFVLQKIANVNTPISIQTINEDLKINSASSSQEYFYGNKGLRRDDVIFGFCVGTDGCGDVFDTVNPVYYKERRIQSIIPFRRVLSAERYKVNRNSVKYFLPKATGNYYEYYVKGFETDPVIKVEYDETGYPSVTKSEIDNENINSTRVINTYVQFTLKISVNDLREYFETGYGNLKKCRINTLSLVYGYPDGKDTEDNNADIYRAVRCFSKINFNNEPFDNTSKELTIIYKIYI